MSRKISDSTVRRLSRYLRILESWPDGDRDTVSSGQLAERAGTTAAQVRKDLSLFGSFGKRGTGYGTVDLTRHLREILGLERTWRLALVGAGRIGAALFEYGALRRRGFHIVAVFDQDPAKVGRAWGPLVVRDVGTLAGVLPGLSADMAVLAVPAPVAQELAELVVAGGIRGILNFAPVRLRLPEEVSVHNVNLVAELESLAFDLTHPDRLAGENGQPVRA